MPTLLWPSSAEGCVQRGCSSTHGSNKSSSVSSCTDGVCVHLWTPSVSTKRDGFRVSVYVKMKVCLSLFTQLYFSDMLLNNSSSPVLYALSLWFFIEWLIHRHTHTHTQDECKNIICLHLHLSPWKPKLLLLTLYTGYFKEMSLLSLRDTTCFSPHQTEIKLMKWKSWRFCYDLSV